MSSAHLRLMGQAAVLALDKVRSQVRPSRMPNKWAVEQRRPVLNFRKLASSQQAMS